MDVRRVDMDKWKAVSELKTGDKVKLTDGSIAEFVRLKEKKFIGTINGAGYDIPVDMFSEVLEKVKQDTTYTKLKVGDPFLFMDNSGNAVVLLFVSLDAKKQTITGINPISKGKTRIQFSMFKGRLKDVLKQVKQVTA